VRLYRLKECKRIHALQFTPDGRELAVTHGYEASGPDRMDWLDLAAGTPARGLDLHDFGFHAQAAATSADLSRLVIANEVGRGTDAPRLVWACNPAAEPPDWRRVDLGLKPPGGTTGMVAVPLALDPTGERLLVSVGCRRRRVLRGEAACDWERELVEYRFSTGGRAAWPVDATGALTPHLTALAIGPDGRRWAATEATRRRGAVTRIDDAPTARAVEEVDARISRLTLSPDSRTLAATAMRKVVLFEAGTLAVQGVLEGTSKAVNDLAFPPDGRMLFTVTSDGTVRVWDRSSARVVKEFDWNIGPLTAVACSPDGTLAAAGGKGGRVAVWDVD
jgi:hypothetical protein